MKFRDLATGHNLTGQRLVPPMQWARAAFQILTVAIVAGLSWAAPVSAADAPVDSPAAIHPSTARYRGDKAGR